jgi:hypothetical protein
MPPVVDDDPGIDVGVEYGPILFATCCIPVGIPVGTCCGTTPPPPLFPITIGTPLGTPLNC